MADVASERMECVKYRVSHIVAFKETTPFFQLHEEWTSSHFSCAEDPDAVKFQIQLQFRKKDIKGLVCFADIHDVQRYPLTFDIAVSGRFISGKRERIVLRRKISVVGVNPEAEIKFIIKDRFHGQDSDFVLYAGDFKHFGHFDLKSAAPETLSIKFEVVYFGAPANVKNTAIPKTDPNLHNDLLRLFVDAECQDAEVTIFAGGRKFTAHKVFLRARSEYFKTMFCSGMKESRTNQLTILDVDPELFEELLRFLYSGLTPKNLRDIAQGLLPLADRFGVTTLKSMCAASIANSLNSKNVIKALLLADTHNSPDLVEKCVPIIRRNFKTLKATKDWQELKNNPEAFAPVLDSLVG